MTLRKVSQSGRIKAEVISHFASKSGVEILNDNSFRKSAGDRRLSRNG